MLDRYSRQRLFAPIGDQGQQALAQAKVLICGCGALGSVLANTLARAGIGYLRIVDRDFVDLSNLQRQVLYTQSDVDAHLPKAIAAANHLRDINREITIDPVVADVDDRNIGDLVDGIDILADGTDNFETRFLLNDIAIHRGMPWVYGGCLGAEGQTFTIVPGETPCLRCVLGDVPPPGTTPTCDAAGVLAPIVNVIASWQACEVLKLASGNRAAVSKTLTVIDLWENTVRQIQLARLTESSECETCQRRIFPWLNGERRAQTAVLCGRNAVQIAPMLSTPLDLPALVRQWQTVGDVISNPYLARLRVGEIELTVFADGRAIVAGTSDPSEARGIVARYLGA